MKHISRLFIKNNFRSKPWLILGKGPSFNEINNINLNDFHTFALNHVVSHTNGVDLVHLIDFDVFEKCQNDIYQKARFLCMPINPHFNNKPSAITISDLIKKNNILKKLSKEGRLFWYNHLSKNRYLNIKNFKRKFYDDIPVKYFSAEAPFHILGLNNIKEIYSAGVDGGSSYEDRFSTSTLLSNGRKSFDVQFDEIIKSIKKYDITYSPLNSSYPVKVYVGSQEEQMLSVKVLEYSIKRRTKVDVEVFPLHRSNISYQEPKDPKNKQRTPFSFQRFLIPQLNNFSGRAIYCDSDMQVLKDIRQLWNLPMTGSDLFTVENKESSNRELQFSVMLLDCDKLRWSITDVVKMLDSGKLDYNTLMKEMRVAKNIGVKIPYYWNCLEWYKKNESGLVHYTDMPTQPWVSTANPLCGVWMKDLIDGIKNGFIDLDMVKEHIEKGWVRPSLLYQINNEIMDSTNLPKKVLELDTKFIAPYKKMKIHDIVQS